MYTPHQFELANGLRVIAVERSQSPTFAASLCYAAGSYDDPPSALGTAHFSEHLAFRGPNRDLVEELARHGSYTNAWTGADYTQFFSSGPVEQLRTALAFFGNVIAVHSPSDSDFRKERQIFAHELKSSGKGSARQEALNRYWASTLGDPIWHLRSRSRAARLKALTADRIEAWRLSHLPISAARLAIVSSLSIEQLRRMLEESLSQVTPPEQVAKDSNRGKSKLHRRINTRFDPYKYSWIYFTYVVRRTDPLLRLTAKVLSECLGNGPDSQLFRRLRSDYPLAYSVKSDDWASRSTTAVWCHATVERVAIRRTVGIMLECVDRVRNCGIGEAQFAAGIERFRRREEMWADYPKELATFLAYESLRPDSDSIVCPAKTLEHLSQFSIHEFNDRAKLLLSKENCYSFVGGRLGLIGRFRLRRQLRNA